MRTTFLFVALAVAALGAQTPIQQPGLVPPPPAIVTPAASGASAGSFALLAYTAKTGTYTAVAGDYVDCTSGTFTVTLPASASNANKVIIVVNSGSGTITVARTGSDVVGNQAETSQTLNPGDSQTYFSGGTTIWRIS